MMLTAALEDVSDLTRFHSLFNSLNRETLELKQELEVIVLTGLESNFRGTNETLKMFSELLLIKTQKTFQTRSS